MASLCRLETTCQKRAAVRVAQVAKILRERSIFSNTSQASCLNMKAIERHPPAQPAPIVFEGEGGRFGVMAMSLAYFIIEPQLLSKLRVVERLKGIPGSGELGFGCRVFVKKVCRKWCR